MIRNFSWFNPTNAAYWTIYFVFILIFMVVVLFFEHSKGPTINVYNSKLFHDRYRKIFKCS